MSKILRGIVFGLAFAMVVCANEPTFTVKLPLGSSVKAGAVVPVRVELVAQDTFVGALSLYIAGQPSYDLTLPVRVGSGRFKYEIPFPALGVEASPTNLRVQLKGEGLSRSLVQNVPLTLEMPHERGTRRILWFGQRLPVKAPSCQAPENSDLKAFADTIEEPILEESEGGGMAEQMQLDLKFDYPKESDLPEDYRLYQGIDVIVFARPSPSVLSTKQASALLKWMKGGGSLVTLGSAVRDGTPLSNMVGDFAGVDADGTQSKRIGFGRYVHVQDPKVLIAKMMSGDDDVLTADAPVVDSGQANPFAARKPTLSFLKWMVVARILQPSLVKSYYSHTQAVSHDHIARALVHLTGLEPISTALVLFYLLAFVLVVTLVERLIVRRLKRPNLTWFLTPLAVVLFFVGAGIISRVSRGNKARNSGVHFEDYSPDGVCITQSQSCVIPAWHKTWRFAAGEDALIFPVPTSQNQISAYSESLNLDMNFSAPVWGNALIAEAALTEKSPPFKATLHSDAGRLKGWVSPRDESAKCVAILYGNQWYSIKADGAVVGGGNPSVFNLKLSEVSGYFRFNQDVNEVSAFETPRLFPFRVNGDDPDWAIIYATGQREPPRKVDGNVRHEHRIFIRQIVPISATETTP